jgi:hypothetical protein
LYDYIVQLCLEKMLLVRVKCDKCGSEQDYDFDPSCNRPRPLCKKCKRRFSFKSRSVTVPSQATVNQQQATQGTISTLEMDILEMVDRGEYAAKIELALCPIYNISRSTINRRIDGLIKKKLIIVDVRSSIKTFHVDPGIISRLKPLPAQPAQVQQVTIPSQPAQVQQVTIPSQVTGQTPVIVYGNHNFEVVLHVLQISQKFIDFVKSGPVKRKLSNGVYQYDFQIKGRGLTYQATMGKQNYSIKFSVSHIGPTPEDAWWNCMRTCFDQWQFFEKTYNIKTDFIPVCVTGKSKSHFTFGILTFENYKKMQELGLDASHPGMWESPDPSALKTVESAIRTGEGLKTELDKVRADIAFEKQSNQDFQKAIVDTQKDLVQSMQQLRQSLEGFKDAIIGNKSKTTDDPSKQGQTDFKNGNGMFL